MSVKHANSSPAIGLTIKKKENEHQWPTQHIQQIRQTREIQMITVVEIMALPRLQS